MATGGSDRERCRQTLTNYKERTETADLLRLTPFLKCLDACGLGSYRTITEASCWAMLQDKAKKISIDKIESELINIIAAVAVANKRKIKGRAPADDPEVVAIADEIRTKIAAKAGSAVVKATKVDSTTARLTDVKGYTGSHKERFTTDGKGKGVDGRKDLVQNTGYVGNYKGSGSYDKAH